jgi:hypothetical protein
MDNFQPAWENPHARIHLDVKDNGCKKRIIKEANAAQDEECGPCSGCSEEGAGKAQAEAQGISSSSPEAQAEAETYGSREAEV